MALRQIGQSSISVAIGKLGTPIAYACMSLTRRECMCPRRWCQMMRRASRVKWLTYQVSYLSGSWRMENSVTQSTVGGGCGSTAGEVHGLLAVHQVQGGGDQGGSMGATTGSDNGEAGGAEPMSVSGSLAMPRWTQSAGSGNGSAS